MSAASINLHRGLLSLGRRFASRLPHGAEVWDQGLGDLAKRALERSSIPAGEMPVVELVEKLAGAKPARRRK